MGESFDGMDKCYKGQAAVVWGLSTIANIVFGCYYLNPPGEVQVLSVLEGANNSYQGFLMNLRGKQCSLLRSKAG